MLPYGGFGCGLRRPAYSGAGLREYLRQYAFLIVDFKGDLPVHVYVEMEVGHFHLFSSSGSSMFLYRLTSLPFTMRQTGTASLSFAVIFPVFIIISTFHFVLGLLPCVSHSLHTTGEKSRPFLKKVLTIHAVVHRITYRHLSIGGD